MVKGKKEKQNFKGNYLQPFTVSFLACMSDLWFCWTHLAVLVGFVGRCWIVRWSEFLSSDRYIGAPRFSLAKRYLTS